MNGFDKQRTIQRYSERFKEHGHSPATLGWGKGGRQAVRFAALSRGILASPESTVLDVGCGLADLYDYLLGEKWHGHYTGVDIVPDLLKATQERLPNIEFYNMDVSSLSFDDGSFDFVVASGIFNMALQRGDTKKYIYHAIREMYRVSRVAVCVDFMSTYVDYIQDGAWHTDPGEIFSFARELSGRVALYHDYLPYEFCLAIRSDDSITNSSEFLT